MNGKRKIKINEAKVLRYVEVFFRGDPNVKIWRQNAGVAFRGDHPVRLAEEGAADLVGIIKEVKCPDCGRVIAEGVFIAIECKGTEGRLRPTQERWLREIQEFGGLVVLAKPIPTDNDPTGFEALKYTLARVGLEYCQECRGAKFIKYKKEEK